MVVGESVWDNHKFEITGTKCDKIDNKKLESCLTSLYGDLNWSWESNSSNIPRVKYLSTNGIPIVEDDLNHFRMFERVLEEFYKNSSNEDTSVVKDYFSFEQIKENNQLDEKFKYNESKIVDKFINLTGVVGLLHCILLM
jgi:benzoyl-CoA reductase/2-hydroxyglutaryl-CoA dehydratase subunit BcrC/BadD/HgdB